MDIVINRPKQFADRMRAYTIKADGSKVGEVNSGEKVTVTIPEKSSTLQVNVDWGLSNEVLLSDLNNNDELTVKNSLSHRLWIPLLPLYFATFGRKRYLQLGK